MTRLHVRLRLRLHVRLCIRLHVHVPFTIIIIITQILFLISNKHHLNMDQAVV